MPYETIAVEKEGRTATVTLHRPESRNAMNVAMIRELIDVAEKLRDDMSLSAVILTGGPTIFTAGVDLKDENLAAIFNEPLAVRRRHFEMGRRMCDAWENLPQVTIAAIEGYCVGGGVSIAVACDFRVVSKKAVFRIPEIGLAMNYSWGSIPRLVNLVGPALTKKWVILTEPIDSDEALRSGFAQWVVEAGEALKTAKTLAQKIESKPMAPVMMTKATVNAITAASSPVAHMDADQFALTLTSEDFQEGVSAFLEKRPPKFNKNIPK
jgi:enoyl-CoA hydratase